MPIVAEKTGAGIDGIKGKVGANEVENVAAVGKGKGCVNDMTACMGIPIGTGGANDVAGTTCSRECFASGSSSTGAIALRFCETMPTMTVSPSSARSCCGFLLVIMAKKAPSGYLNAAGWMKEGKETQREREKRERERD